MDIQSLNIFTASAALEQIERDLKNQQLPEEKLPELAGALDAINSKTKEWAQSDFPLFSEFTDRIKAAKKQLFNRDVTLILNRAKDLEKVGSKDIAAIAVKVDALKEAVLSFEERYGSDYFFTEYANEFIECASAMIHEEKWNSKEFKGRIQELSETLLELLEENKDKITPDMQDIIMELFDIASLIRFPTKQSEGKRKLNELLALLPKEQKKKILQDRNNIEKLKLTLLQVGHELAGLALPFEKENMDKWFEEADQYAEVPNFVYQNEGMIRA